MYIYSYLFILYMCVLETLSFHALQLICITIIGLVSGKSHRNLLSMMVIRHGFLVITWDN